MAHLHRFYVPGDALVEGEVALPPDEAHHARSVLRVRVGDRVAVLDGTGREGTGRVSRAEKGGVHVLVETLRETPEPARPLTLAQAWLNHEKSVETIIRRGAELGVARIIFFKAERSERPPRLRDKWRRIAIESCKQSGCLWLPELSIAEDLFAVLSETAGTMLLATMGEGGTPLRSALAGREPVLVAVGPEGDFSEAEVAASIECGAVSINLGRHTLRSEVAATVAVSLVQYELGNLGPID